MGIFGRKFEVSPDGEAVEKDLTEEEKRKIELNRRHPGLENSMLELDEELRKLGVEPQELTEEEKKKHLEGLGKKIKDLKPKKPTA